WCGTGDSCAQSQKVTDNGIYPDRAAGDGVFSLGGLTCMKSPYPNLNWDSSIILFNATDKKGHTTQSRTILSVIPGPTGGAGGGGGNSTGRPANLRWNGRQGYNIFNASQWDQFKYTASETRTFRATDEVVVVVGSLDLENTFDTDRFTLYDPFSGYPSQPVVYGTSKVVSASSTPSTSQGFTQATTTFKSTAVAYIQLRMFTTDATVTNVVFGNIIIKDYAGGTQLMRAPVNGHDVNVPICPVTAACSAGTAAISINSLQRVYRFS